MSKEIEEGNKLIAEFMGKLTKENNVDFSDEPLNGYSLFRLEDAKYHSSWDWLMPVVEKIRSEHLVANIYFHTHCTNKPDIYPNEKRYYCIIEDFDGHSYSELANTSGNESLIKTVYEAIIIFLTKSDKVENK